VPIGSQESILTPQSESPRWRLSRTNSVAENAPSAATMKRDPYSQPRKSARIEKRVSVSFMSVVLREDTASGTEIFPVLHRDGRIRVDADDTSSVIRDLLFDSRIGVDDDEHSRTVVVADADFEMVVDRVVVDDVVHCSGSVRTSESSPAGTSLLYHTQAGSQPIEGIFPKLGINCG
jgi:hypothetical protein